MGRVQALKQMIQGRFARSAGGLAVASALGQGILMLSLVVMDWGYTQDHIGIYSAFVAYSAIIQVANLFAYPWSLPNVEARQVRPLLGLLLVLTAASTGAVGLGFWAGGSSFAAGLAVFTLGKSLVLIAEQVNVRQQSYRPIIWSRLLAPLLFLGMIAAPWLGWAASAEVLTWAHALSQLVTGLVYGGATLAPLARRGAEEEAATWGAMVSVARAERRNAVYMMPSQLFNVLAYNLPVILIKDSMSAALAAQYAVMLRAGMTPINIIGGAIGQVYHGRVARIVRERLAGGYAQYRRLQRLLLAGGVAISAGLATVAPWVLEWVFGEEWALAGLLLQVMSPALGLIFASSPLTGSMAVFEDQRFLFGFQLSYLVIAAASFGIGIAAEELVLGCGIFSGLTCARYVALLWRLRRLHQTHLLPLDQAEASSQASRAS